MDINYELYKVFYHVATTLSFSEAANKLFISQSAVSQSIKALEKKLNQKLFIRSTKKVRLTPEGELLLRHVEPAMNLIHRGEIQLLEASEGVGQLRIGASDTICRYFLVPYLERFHKEFPGAHIKVTNATSIHCVELLENGQVDLIVVNSPNPYLGNCETKHIRSFQDVFVANHSFDKLVGRCLSYKELLEHPILMLDKKSTTSEFLHNLFLQIFAIFYHTYQESVMLPLHIPDFSLLYFLYYFLHPLFYSHCILSGFLTSVVLWTDYALLQPFPLG